MEKNNIRYYRELAGISQAELGRRSGISQQVIDLIEKGDRQLKVSQLEDIADALGIKPYLLVDSDAWNPGGDLIVSGLYNVRNSSISKNGNITINPNNNKLSDYEKHMLEEFNKLSKKEQISLIYKLQNKEIPLE